MSELSIGSVSAAKLVSFESEVASHFDFAAAVPPKPGLGVGLAAVTRLDHGANLLGGHPAFDHGLFEAQFHLAPADLVPVVGHEDNGHGGHDRHHREEGVSVLVGKKCFHRDGLRGTGEPGFLVYSSLASEYCRIFHCRVQPPTRRTLARPHPRMMDVKKRTGS